ncbi:Cof subfamily of IIB subfamily of haloacid dehalogenase superfamily/HAD-superfamily hydrolase, subfamily IIB [Sphingomonas antarctica]|uniref:Cof-type HAD-IIB family hydrolase n=1 Tax=Sphingomonas antarctica TaxID=2040274 RepID=UPI0039EA90C2
MTVRLLVSDIDGTLVRKDKSLPDANIAAIRQIVAAGCAVSLISARPPSGILPIAQALGLPGPFAAFNGGTVFDVDGGIRAAHRLSPRIAGDMAVLFARHDVIRWLYADGQWLTNALDEVHTLREVIAAGIDPIVTERWGDALERADKMVAVSDDDALLTRVEGAARELAGGDATIARSQPYYLDITARAANKGDGLAELARIADVPLTEVAVMGDADNDLRMFASAGLSVAMGQSHDRVKSAATFATDAIMDDAAVAEAIERFILPRVNNEV